MESSELLEAGVIGEMRPSITDMTPYRNRRAVPIKGEPLSETQRFYSPSVFHEKHAGVNRPLPRRK